MFRHEKVVDAAFGADGERIKPRQLTVEALRRSALSSLAEQMGSEMTQVRGDALRRSAELTPSRTLLNTAEFLEPHRRG